MEHNFLEDLRTFETTFGHNLTYTSENSVLPFYSEVSEEFMRKLADLDWESYRSVDLETSLIDVDVDGITRIIIAHRDVPQERDSKWFRRGVEIIISDEITIDFFTMFATCFTVIGNPTYFHLLEEAETKNENEPKWEYSEIDVAIQKLSDNFENGTRIKRFFWREEIISQGIWEHDKQEYWMVPLFRPRVRLTMVFTKEEPREEITSIDWKRPQHTKVLGET